MCKPLAVRLLNTSVLQSKTDWRFFSINLVWQNTWQRQFLWNCWKLCGKQQPSLSSYLPLDDTKTVAKQKCGFEVRNRSQVQWDLSIGTELCTYELLDSSVGIVTLLTAWTAEEKRFNYRQISDEIWDHPATYWNSTGFCILEGKTADTWS